MDNTLKGTWKQLGRGKNKRLKGRVIINSKANVHKPCKRVAKEGVMAAGAAQETLGLWVGLSAATLEFFSLLEQATGKCCSGE